MWVSIKLKCVKIIQRKGFVLIGINANLLMVCKNCKRIYKIQKDLRTVQRNVSHFGILDPAVMDLDVNFFIMKTKDNKTKHFFK
jgi:hypothetical protein